MKYYSEILRRTFDTVEELENEEKKVKEAEQKKELMLSKKKERAELVNNAFKELQDVRKEYYAKLREKEENYIKLRDEFVKDYGSWHMTYSSDNDNYCVSDVFKDFSTMFKEFFNF